jgi:hypothetical protein
MATAPIYGFGTAVAVFRLRQVAVIAIMVTYAFYLQNMYAGIVHLLELQNLKNYHHVYIYGEPVNTMHDTKLATRFYNCTYSNWDDDTIDTTLPTCANMLADKLADVANDAIDLSGTTYTHIQGKCMSNMSYTVDTVAMRGAAAAADAVALNPAICDYDCQLMESYALDVRYSTNYVPGYLSETWTNATIGLTIPHTDDWFSKPKEYKQYIRLMYDVSSGSRQGWVDKADLTQILWVLPENDYRFVLIILRCGLGILCILCADACYIWVKHVYLFVSRRCSKWSYLRLQKTRYQDVPYENTGHHLV